MQFTYIATGSLKLIGCSGPNSSSINVLTAYSEGQLVYIKKNARRGQLKPIRIKKINIVNALEYNYQDITNRIWLESELCDSDTAQTLIDIYQSRHSVEMFQVNIQSDQEIQSIYSAGDLVYNRRKAALGKLESIRIKTINSVDSQKYNYEDITNRIWLESELCDLETAQGLIKDRENKKARAYNIYLRNCSTKIN